MAKASGSATHTDHGTQAQPHGHGEHKTRDIIVDHESPVVRKAEERLVRYNRKALKRIGKQAAGIAREAYGAVHKAAGDPEDVAKQVIEGIDWTAYVDYTDSELNDVIRDAVKQVALRLGIEDDEQIVQQVYDQAETYAHDRSAELVGKKWNGDLLIDNPNAAYAITDTLREGIKDLTAQAINEGWSADTLAKNVEGLGNFSAARSEMIARTEIIRANNQGHLTAFKASGVVEGKKWIAGEGACQICLDNEAQGPIPLEEDFDSGDDAAPAHPNCRCTITAVVHLPDGSETDIETDDNQGEDQ